MKGLLWVEGGERGAWISNKVFFSSGDVVMVELERRHGQDGVMRVRMAGKAFVWEMTIPHDGVLYGTQPYTSAVVASKATAWLHLP